MAQLLAQFVQWLTSETLEAQFDVVGNVQQAMAFVGGPVVIQRQAKTVTAQLLGTLDDGRIGIQGGGQLKDDPLGIEQVQKVAHQQAGAHLDEGVFVADQGAGVHVRQRIDDDVTANMPFGIFRAVVLLVFCWPEQVIW